MDVGYTTNFYLKFQTEWNGWKNSLFTVLLDPNEFLWIVFPLVSCSWQIGWYHLCPEKISSISSTCWWTWTNSFCYVFCFMKLSLFTMTNQIVVYIIRSKQFSWVLESRERIFQRRWSIPRSMHPSLNAREWVAVRSKKRLATANVKWRKQQSKDEENSHVKLVCTEYCACYAL